MLMMIAIGWMYVVLMMALTEHSFIAGVMTFFLYGVFPLSIVLYLLGTKQRRLRREYQRQQQAMQGAVKTPAHANQPSESPQKQDQPPLDQP